MLLAVTTDLMFGSRIAEVARTLGVPCQVARGVDGLVERARAAAPSLVIVDLLMRDADAAAAIAALRAEPATREVEIVGFFPHVMEELAEAARAAGVSRVLTRGQLSKQLPQLIEGARG